jgi:hypothetical protein
MTAQQQADAALSIWQLQRRLGIPAEARALPINDNKSADDFERDLEVIRQCIERRT